MPEFKLKIAGFVGQVHALFDSTPYYLGHYTTEEAADFVVTVTREDLERERRMRDLEAAEEGFKPRVVTDPFLERLAIQRKFAEFLMTRDVLMVHGSAVAVDGVGYVFTARCGTGKSTHTRLWRQVFGDRAVMINDDKPFLRLTEGEVLLCGAPWSGKHGLDTNTQVPLGGICLLERGVTNEITPASAEDLESMAKELRWYMESDGQAVFNALARRLLSRIPTWSMRCNMDPEAAKISHSAMAAGKIGAE